MTVRQNLCAGPGPSVENVSPTLFDRLFPLYQTLPANHEGDGQIVVAAGDAMTIFDPTSVDFNWPGIVALGVAAAPEAASKHGVFCVEPDGRVRLVLQKPSLSDQERLQAVRVDGRTVLDIGLMNFDAPAAVQMLQALEVQIGGGSIVLSQAVEKLIVDLGLDLYRELTCALGTEATAAQHAATCHASGSKWSAEQLAPLFEGMHSIPMYCEIVPKCSFLHFGTTRQLIASGEELLENDGVANAEGLVSVNNWIGASGRIHGYDSWIEGCRIDAPLSVAGENVVVGIDIASPLALPRGAVLDVIEGQTPSGCAVWFVRCYHVGDTFKDTLAKGATLAGRPLLQWLNEVGLQMDQVWDKSIPQADRSLWDCKVFPAVDSAQGYRDWLWMYDPSQANASQKLAYRTAERFSVAEIALLADIGLFYKRRGEVRKKEK